MQVTMQCATCSGVHRCSGEINKILRALAAVPAKVERRDGGIGIVAPVAAAELVGLGTRGRPLPPRSLLGVARRSRRVAGRGGRRLLAGGGGGLLHAPRRPSLGSLGSRSLGRGRGRRRPLLPDHVDEPPRQVLHGAEAGAAVAPGLDDLPDGAVGVGLGHLVLPVEGHRGAGLDEVGQLGLEVVRGGDGVVLGGVGAVGRVDRRVVLDLVLVVEEDGVVDGAGKVTGARGAGLGGPLCLLLGQFLRIPDGTGEAEGAGFQQVAQGGQAGAGAGAAAAEDDRGRGPAAHEADRMGLRRHHVDAGAAPAAAAAPVLALARAAGALPGRAGRRRRAAGRVVRREAEDAVPPLLDGEPGGRPLPPPPAGAAGTAGGGGGLAARILRSRGAPGPRGGVLLGGGGGDQLLEVVLFLLLLVVERSSPSVAILGRRGPPPSLLVVALAAAAVAVAEADLHFGRLVGGGKARSADAAAAVGRAVQAPRQRIEEQDHRHVWLVG